MLVMMIDGLHTLNLGVLQRYVVRVFWSLINADSWQVGGPQEIIRTQSVSLLRGMLMSWYKQNKHLGLTEVLDLSLPMLGDGDKQNILKTKASETKGLTYFCLHLLGELGHHIQDLAGPLMAAGRAITQYMDCLDRYPPPTKCTAVPNFIHTWHATPKACQGSWCRAEPKAPPVHPHAAEHMESRQPQHIHHFLR